MSAGEDLLVSDAERAAATSELREHYESGRLTLDEFESRLVQVETARTESALREAFRQLPSKTMPTLSPLDVRWRSLALQYLLVNVVAMAVWVSSGGHGDFWPRWVFLATLLMFLRRVFRPTSGRRSRSLPAGPEAPQLPDER